MRTSNNCGIISKDITYTWLEYEKEKKEGMKQKIFKIIMVKIFPTLTTDPDNTEGPSRVHIFKFYI